MLPNRSPPFSECNGKEETTVYPPRLEHAPPKINRSPRWRGTDPTTAQRDTMSAYGGSPGERKVYITEEFDSTLGTWPRLLSILSRQICPAGRHGGVCACRSYYSLLRNRWSRIDRSVIPGPGRFPPTCFAASVAVSSGIPEFPANVR